jgi:pimeloyl-ACP methyl ester carboxylesterase
MGLELAQAFTGHRTIRAGEVEAHVAEAGDGPVIVLLHGNPDTHAVWGPVVARLAPKHRCIAPDLPGFGKSRAPADFSFSLASQGAFVRDLLGALELTRVHLVVHDVGGPYGLAFATEHPEQIESLTIFNTNFFPDLRWHFWARVWRTRILGEIAMGIANRPLFVREMRRGSPRMPKEYAVHAYREFTRSTRRNVLRWYRAMDPEVHAGWDEQLLAATAKTPKQVLWGDLDPFLPARTADRFGGTVTHFSDCGHWVMLEEPERAAAAIAGLVAKRSRRAG